MNFTKKSMKYAVAIFTVFAISGLLYTSSITQYGFAQNNSSSNSSSSGGSGSQGNSTGGGSSSGQKNDVGTAAEMHNLTGAGTQKILSNNSKISNSGGLTKLGNESSMDKPNMTKGASSQPFPTQSQAAGQPGNQSLTGQNVGQSQNQSSSSGGAGQQSSGGAGQSQNQSSSSGGAGQSQNQSSSSGGAGQQSSGGAGQSQNQSSSSGGAGQSKNQSSNPLDMLAKLFSGG